ncbi:hypothetical protein [Hymenobacter sp. PAMC 26628]|uniref:hypothetical protein n=1 Tax=Hymenobacter sp. PAMC 26628 TaxID=1484118 RepID=UPI000770595A|nr:hypothetical protein [Hymenobacter sp. PAMC 26628]AMJ65247.1 hypothetical protein AXW84_07270 [Hymenobacter sp. PAMC 26628]
MRCYLLLLVLLLAGSTAFAQARPPVSRPDSAVAGALAPAAPDTLAAIHKLFATRRRQQTFGALGIVAAAVAGIAIEQLSSDTDKNLNALGTGVLAVPVLAVELFAFDAFNRKHERQAANDFKAHKPDKWLRRKLKSRFFH